MLKFEHEIWKPVKDFEEIYEVSNLGRVSNYRKILKTYKINSNYECIKLSKDNRVHSFLLHRLVAITFLDNPDGKPVVNHLDGDRLNNCVSNLEWVTTKENVHHAKDCGRMPYNKPTLGINKGKTSKYRNVTKHNGTYRATIRVNNRNWFPKSFKTEEEAALHVNWIIDELGLTDRVKNDVQINA